MPDEGPGRFLARSLRVLQENLRNTGPAMAAGYTLPASMLVFGGVGFLLDRWLETPPWLLLAGLGLGIVVGFAELARIVWRR